MDSDHAMLDLFHDETHSALYEAVEAWASREIAPNALDWEEAGGFPDELFTKAGEAGLLGACYPEEYGGGDGDIFHLLTVCEALIRGGKSVGTAVGLGSHAIAVPPILKMGSAELKRRFVPPVCTGEQVAALLLDGAKPTYDAEVDLGSVNCAGDDRRHALVYA